MSCEIHYNDIGTEFRATIVDCNEVAINISLATELYLIFKKPSGASVTQTASFTDDGSDGQISYTTVDGDLDEIGTWKIQAEIVAPNGTWRSVIKSFKVYRNI